GFARFVTLKPAVDHPGFTIGINHHQRKRLIRQLPGEFPDLLPYFLPVFSMNQNHKVYSSRLNDGMLMDSARKAKNRILSKTNRRHFGTVPLINLGDTVAAIEVNQRLRRYDKHFARGLLP